MRRLPNIHQYWRRLRHERLSPVCAVSAVLASALSLPACVFHQSYPASWAAHSEGCQDISGIYSDAGERRAESVPFPYTGTVVAMRSLSALLLGAGGFGTPFRIELTQRDEHRLEFRLWVDDSVGARYSTEYRCTAEGIAVKMPAQWITERLGALRAWGTLYLTKDTDGNLIGNLKYRTYGIILVIPIVGGGNPWYRFRSEAPLPP